MSDYFGPALPPEYSEGGEESVGKSTYKSKSKSRHKHDKHKKDKKQKSRKRKKSSSSEDSDSSSSDSSSNSGSSDSESDGEPKRKKKSKSQSLTSLESQTINTCRQPIGPVLPAGMQLGNTESQESSDIIGPVMPEGLLPVPQADEDDEDVIGPMPSQFGQSDEHSAAREIERRAEKMRERLDHANDEVVQERESWMLELPQQLGANLGLGARKFKMKPGEENNDRSGWTDSPADKERKLKEEKEEEGQQKAAEFFVSKRDQQFTSQITEYNETKRAKSLMELHSEKLHGKKKKSKKEKKEKKEKHKSKKKKKEKEKEKKSKDKAKPKEPRRAFDRDLDLQVNKFDEAQRKSIIKRSQELNSRFAGGKTTSQFL